MISCQSAYHTQEGAKAACGDLIGRNTQACSSHTVPSCHITYSQNRTHRTYLTLRPRGVWISDYQHVVKMKRSISEVSKDTQDLPIQLLTPKGKIPTCSTYEAPGYDLYSSEDIKVPPRTRILVSTDFAIQVPPGTYGRIAPRSGLSVKNCIDIGAGVIDKDYRAQIKILLISHSDTEFLVQQGDRIAQLILEQVKTPDTKTVQSLQSTERGSKGFGSTGISSKPVHGERLFFKAKLKTGGYYIQARLLLDCGATSPILREEYAKDNQILTKQRKKPISIWNASQQPIAGAG